MALLFYVIIGICSVAGFWLGYKIIKNIKNKKKN